MNKWLFLTFMLMAAFLLAEFDRALMVFQIRERLGFDPLVAMQLGSVSGVLSQILVAVAITMILLSIAGEKRE